MKAAVLICLSIFCLSIHAKGQGTVGPSLTSLRLREYCRFVGTDQAKLSDEEYDHSHICLFYVSGVLDGFQIGDSATKLCVPGSASSVSYTHLDVYKRQGPGEVLVRVAASSVNPIDYKRRAGLTKDFYPLQFPGLIGVDIAGTVVNIGPGVEGFSVGDQVFAMADNTYAELCVVKAAVLAKVPTGLDLIQAAALPLVTTTGNQLLSATGIRAGETVLVVGAVGNVGRSAVFTAKDRGANVIAGVLKRQMDEAKTVGADQVVATDDDTAIANLPPLDAVADTVGGRTAEKLIAKVKPGGVYASVVGAPKNAAEYSSVCLLYTSRCV